MEKRNFCLKSRISALHFDLLKIGSSNFCETPLTIPHRLLQTLRVIFREK